ncbi:hypothetical protein SADUNF_Sadunf02G0172200 [Salix dunnii]|uniref:Uncharacterized protein n=1 Tax=Salix dunnii TaxID=1413687 RepID=A0A835N8T6_9ROSI|nr:hypothetical protein SADUNF_Sadunf02G0172200 [Salix dunnii]
METYRSHCLHFLFHRSTEAHFRLASHHHMTLAIYGVPRLPQYVDTTAPVPPVQPLPEVIMRFCDISHLVYQNDHVLPRLSLVRNIRDARNQMLNGSKGKGRVEEKEMKPTWTPSFTWEDFAENHEHFRGNFVVLPLPPPPPSKNIDEEQQPKTDQKGKDQDLDLNLSL